ncbi:GAF domain-containing protein [Actinomadura sp. ATCC 31491]|uniref:GAF domain-containing protein n=1 Tax=Actinomadura luzonensis TaxID=2805427 RepID=A0ABT0FJA2_9ACTN|nr:GAF domain-containing protein [Actinomadura luzonensis]MCK2212377.1 GAF domain-containing protein [Actinomadura luzonensis]
MPGRKDPAKRTGGKRFTRSGIFRYGLPFLLTVVTAVCTAMATLSAIPIRVYWTLGIVAAIAANAFINLYKERAAEDAKRLAITAKASLVDVLLNQWQPVITAVQNVAAAESLTRKEQALSGLRQVTVGLASKIFSENSDKSFKTRATLYLFDNDQHELLRDSCQGRPSDGMPPSKISPDRNGRPPSLVKKDIAAIEIALGENAVLINSVTEHEITRDNTEGYRSCVVVPVQANGAKFGLFIVDSDQESSFSDEDKGLVIMMAHLLAAGLADVRTYRSIAAGSPKGGTNSALAPSLNNSVPTTRDGDESTTPIGKTSQE